MYSVCEKKINLGEPGVECDEMYICVPKNLYFETLNPNI